MIARKARTRNTTTSTAAHKRDRPGGSGTSLTKRELAGFRTMLLKKRRSLLGDLNGLAAEMIASSVRHPSGAPSSVSDHPADFGSDCHEMEMTAGLLASERVLLREIDEALDRIESGTYGICLGTGRPIGKARLRARPWAKYCIEYARQIERRPYAFPGQSQRTNEGMRICQGTAGEDTEDAPADVDLLELDRS